MTALLLWRFRFPAKPALEGALGLPIVVPEICMGVAMLVFFTQVLPWPTELPWPLNLGAIIISHISFSFSFVAIVVRARLASFNRELEEAAKDLGAGEWRIFWDVIVPHMRPGLIAGALLAFTLSLDDFVITFFTSGPGHHDLPGQGLFHGPLLGDAGGQRRLHHPDRAHRGADRHRPAAAGRATSPGRSRGGADGMTAKPIIRFENVTKRFGKVTAVDNVSLTIEEGEFFALLGPSGCGKTTLLRMLAGFETPTEGRILIDDAGHHATSRPTSGR